MGNRFPKASQGLSVSPAPTAGSTTSRPSCTTATPRYRVYIDPMQTPSVSVQTLCSPMSPGQLFLWAPLWTPPPRSLLRKSLLPPFSKIPGAQQSACLWVSAFISINYWMKLSDDSQGSHQSDYRRWPVQTPLLLGVLGVSLAPGFCLSLKCLPFKTSLSMLFSSHLTAHVPTLILISVYPGDLFSFPFPGKCTCLSLGPLCYLSSLELWAVAWLFFTLHAHPRRSFQHVACRQCFRSSIYSISSAFALLQGDTVDLCVV